MAGNYLALGGAHNNFRGMAMVFVGCVAHLVDSEALLRIGIIYLSFHPAHLIQTTVERHFQIFFTAIADME
jgi:hypothetical protein